MYVYTNIYINNSILLHFFEFNIFRNVCRMTNVECRMKKIPSTNFNIFEIGVHVLDSRNLILLLYFNLVVSLQEPRKGKNLYMGENLKMI